MPDCPIRLLHTYCVANRRIAHATDMWGMYLYSLIMIVAFSKEALLEYSCFKTICSNANSIGASVAVERPEPTIGPRSPIIGPISPTRSPLGHFDIKLIFGTGRRFRSLLRLPQGLARYCSTSGIGPLLPRSSQNV